MMKTDFKLFDPSKMDKSKLPDLPGNYFVVLRKGCQLPTIDISPIYHKLEYDGEQYDIVYKGISNDSLRKRDYSQHFTGNNAGRSTLRKSLGCMMGFKQVPRDKNKPENGKTKFNDSDEIKLSDWMQKNLLLFYKPCREKEEIEKAEKSYIDSYNPPLNMQGNMNEENKQFRDQLKRLRNSK